MKALFFHAVWGAEYIANFVRYSLPTQITEGNLRAFDIDSLFLIATVTTDKIILENSAEIRELEKIMRVDYILVTPTRMETLKKRSKYSILTYFQNMALRRSRDFEVIFFGYADAIWADGSYRAAVQRIEEGYDAVFSPGYPVLDTQARPQLDAKRSNRSAEIVLSKREIASMVFTCLHPMAQANITTNGRMSEAPSYLFWPVEGQGLLMRAFHIHPVVFRVRQDSIDFLMPFRTTLDEEFVARITRYRGGIHISPSSDEMAVCSLMGIHDRSYFTEPYRALTTTEMAIFGEACAGLVHRLLALHSVRLQYADGEEEPWQQAEAKADRFMRDVLLQLNTPDSVIALESPLAYQARYQRQQTYKHWNEERNLIELAEELFDERLEGVIAKIYLQQIAIGILRYFHKIKVGKLFRWLVLPLLPRKTANKIRRFAYDAGLPSNQPEQQSIEIELLTRLQGNLEFKDFLRVLMRRRFPSRSG